MKRLGPAVALVAVLLVAAPAVASADSITPMCTVGQGPTLPCGSGWYTAPVFLSWTWSPLTTGSGSCQAAPYDADTVRTLSCAVSWTDGFSGTQLYTLHVETSSPTATVAPNRAPDSGGWYNHAVASAVSAAAFSGVASCTSTTYSGANTTAATLSATCVDNAGKTVTATSAPFAYDTAPPSLAASAGAGDRSVTVSWHAGGDIAPIAFFNVQRSPGSAGAAGDTVYRGTSNAFQDTNLQNGVQYTYTITAVDAAGNSSVQTVAATPRPQVLATTPLGGAATPTQPPPVVASPPILTWAPVRHATYYNVQLYRNGKKVLSMWPVKAQLQLRRTWRLDGRKYTLRPGRYKWYVWPGFGRRNADSYGHRIGSGTFVVH